MVAELGPYLNDRLLNQHFSVETTHVYCLKAWKFLKYGLPQKHHKWCTCVVFLGFLKTRKMLHVCVVSEITDSIIILKFMNKFSSFKENMCAHAKFH